MAYEFPKLTEENSINGNKFWEIPETKKDCLRLLMRGLQRNGITSRSRLELSRWVEVCEWKDVEEVKVLNRALRVAVDEDLVYKKKWVPRA